jgi:hypothetical protein
MTEELEQNEEQEEQSGQSIWEMLELDEPGAGEDEQDEQDEEVSKANKLEKKMSAKMENMQKKFENTMLRERIKTFEAEADELDVDMFRTVASDVKSLEDFDRAMTLVQKQSAQLRETAEKYRERMESEAAQATARAWGTGPVGTPQARRTPDYEEESFKKIAAGDVDELYRSLVEDDAPWMKP